MIYCFSLFLKCFSYVSSPRFCFTMFLSACLMLASASTVVLSISPPCLNCFSSMFQRVSECLDFRPLRFCIFLYVLHISRLASLCISLYFSSMFQRVSECLDFPWICTLMEPPYLTDTLAAPFLINYYPDGVGLSAFSNTRHSPDKPKKKHGKSLIVS